MKKLLLFILVSIFLSNFTYGFSPPPDTFQVYGILKVSDENGISFKALMDSVYAFTGGNVIIPKLRSDSAYFNKYLILQATSMSDVPTVPSQGLLMLENGTRQLRYYGKDYAGNIGWHTIPDSAMVRTFAGGDSNWVKIAVDTITTNRSDSTVYISKNLSVGNKTTGFYDFGYISVGGMSTYGKVYGLSYLQHENYHFNLGQNIHRYPFDTTNSWMRDDSVNVWGSNLLQISSGATNDAGRKKQGFGFWYNKSGPSALNLRQIILIATGDSGTVRGMAINTDTSNVGYPRKTLDIKSGSSILGDTAFVEVGSTLNIVPWDTVNAIRNVWLFPPYGVIDTIRVPDRTKTNFLVSTVPLQMGTYRITLDFTEQDYGTVFLPKSTGQEIALVVRMPIPDDWEGWPDSSALVIQNSGNTLNYVKKVVIMRSNINNPFPNEVDSLTYTTYKAKTHDWGYDGGHGISGSQGIKFGASKLTSSWTRDSIMYIRIHVYGNDVDVDPAIVGMIRMRYKTKHGYH